jgi:hypothetical protein
MFNRYYYLFITAMVLLFVLCGQTAQAQGVTTASLTGVVSDDTGETLPEHP